jgi:hypothetical protein
MLELLGLEQREDAADRVMRRNAVLERPELAKPGALRAAEVGELAWPIAAGNGGGFDAMAVGGS